MLLKRLEEFALESLNGKGIAYSIDSQFVLRYIIWIFIAHFVIYVLLKRKKFSAKKYFPKFFFALYFVIVISFTILPIEFPGINETVVSWNFSLTPILEAFHSRAQLINIAGNILLFAPIPILGLWSKFKIFGRWSTTLIFSIVVSVFLEAIQYFEIVHGYTYLAVVDMVDIITNTAGGLIGWIAYKFYYRNHNPSVG